MVLIHYLYIAPLAPTDSFLGHPGIPGMLGLSQDIPSGSDLSLVPKYLYLWLLRLSRYTPSEGDRLIQHGYWNTCIPGYLGLPQDVPSEFN